MFKAPKRGLWEGKRPCLGKRKVTFSFTVHNHDAFIFILQLVPYSVCRFAKKDYFCIYI